MNRLGHLLLAAIVFCGWVLALVLSGVGLLGTVAVAGSLLGLALVRRFRAGRLIYFNTAVFVLIGGVGGLAYNVKNAPPRVDVMTSNESASVETQGAPSQGPPVSAVNHPVQNPTRHVSRHVVRYSPNEILFDVSYTTDEFGMRLGPPRAIDSEAPCVLMFGCSFVYGVGVNDGETLSYRTEIHSGGAFQARNFGDPGTGPHQMLAAIEGGEVARRANCRPTHALYVVIPEHIGRASGRPNAPGDPYAPRYRLQDDGRVFRDGNFFRFYAHRRDLPVVNALVNWLDRWTYQQDDPSNTELLFAITEEAHEQLGKLYPGVELHMLIWDRESSTDASDPRIEWMRNHPYPRKHLVSEILPPVEDWEGIYQIPQDRHPTAHANDLLAKYIYDTILVNGEGGHARGATAKSHGTR